MYINYYEMIHTSKMLELFLELSSINKITE